MATRDGGKRVEISDTEGRVLHERKTFVTHESGVQKKMMNNSVLIRARTDEEVVI